MWHIYIFIFFFVEYQTVYIFIASCKLERKQTYSTKVLVFVLDLVAFGKSGKFVLSRNYSLTQTHNDRIAR